jgi:hypothetical protein
MTSSINTKQSMESRLLALETSLGLLQPTNSNSSSINNPTNKNNTRELSSRLDALEHKFQSFSTPLTIWSESDALLQELHPLAGLSYQEPSSNTRNDPIMYRRQQVLASADDMKRDFSQLNTIMNLLLIAQSTKKLSEEQVFNAPIITSAACADPNSTARLETLLLDIAITRQQTMAMANRVDSLIQTYHTIVMALSERMLLLNQTLATKEH